MKKVVLTAFITIVAVSTYAQDAFKQGHITYTIAASTTGDATNPQAQQAMQMLNGSKMDITVADSMTRVDMDLGMMQTHVISNNKTMAGTMLMEMMGNKYSMTLSPSDVKEQEAKAEGNYDVKYVDSTKMIQNHICKKAVVTMKKDKKEMDVWYDPSVNVPVSGKNMYSKIKGLPMEYSMEASGMVMKFTCTAIDANAVDPSIFKIPDGYTALSPDQVKAFMKAGHGD